MGLQARPRSRLMDIECDRWIFRCVRTAHRPAAAQRPPQPRAACPAARTQAQPPAAAQPRTCASAAEQPQGAAQPNAQPFPPPPEVFGFATVQRSHAAREAAYENRSTQIPQAIAQLSYDQYRASASGAPTRCGTTSRCSRCSSSTAASISTAGSTSPKWSDGVCPPRRLQPGLVRFRRGRSRRHETAAGPGLCRLSRPLPVADARLQGRADRVPRRLVFPGAGTQPGLRLSARGLAINTATTAGEEFPYFTDFWLVQPQTGAAHADDLRAAGQREHHRRLSVRGAARARITQVEVTATLYPRAGHREAGHRAADLDVPVWRGPVRARFDDYRPEVHDSDGLHGADRRRASGCGGRWSIRGSCASTASWMSIRAASA